MGTGRALASTSWLTSATAGAWTRWFGLLVLDGFGVSRDVFEGCLVVKGSNSPKGSLRPGLSISKYQKEARARGKQLPKRITRTARCRDERSRDFRDRAAHSGQQGKRSPHNTPVFYFSVLHVVLVFPRQCKTLNPSERGDRHHIYSAASPSSNTKYRRNLLGNTRSRSQPRCSRYPLKHDGLF